MKKKLIVLALVLAMAVMPVAAYANSSGGHSSADETRTYTDPAKPVTSSVPAATTAEATLKQSAVTNGLTPGAATTAANGAINFVKADGSILKSSWAVVAGAVGNVWKYFDADGNMIVNKWVWVKGSDGKTRCYYLGADGTCYMNGVTPDGYTVDATGAWYKDNRVQFQ